MLKPGTIIAGRYVVVRLIGEGGMGSVYEAKHTGIGKRVAIKILSKDYSTDTEAVQRFQQEARIAGTIGHLNICEVMDFGVTDDGRPFLIMEYLRGESLASILAREKRLPLDISLGILKQILEAIEEVHLKGIIHRDLKPENIYIAEVKGHGLVVKILDFGVSKVMSAVPDSIRLTKTGGMIGTAYYMSPEQVRGSKEVDHRADMYACGVILYEMLTGHVPYGGSHLNEVIARILENPFPDPRMHVPELPIQVVKLLRKSMDKNAAKRFESATQFKDDAVKILSETTQGKSDSILSTKMSSMVNVSPLFTSKGVTLKVASILMFAVVVLAAMATLAIILHGKRRTSDNVVKKVEGRNAGHMIAMSSADSSVENEDRTASGISETAVSIKLYDAPYGVRIVHDGRTIEGNTLVLERGPNPIHFTITATGYEDREITIAPTENMMINGKLNPLLEEQEKPPEGKEPENKSKATSTKEAKPKKTGEKPDASPPQQETQKKKTGHIWSYPGD